MTRINLIFSVLSITVSPDKMAAMFPVLADNTVLRGLDREPPQQRPPKHGWFLDLHYNDDTTTLDDAVSALLRRAYPIIPQLVELRRLDAALEVKTRVAIAPIDENFSLSLQLPTICRLAELQSWLDVEFVELWTLEQINPTM